MPAPLVAMAAKTVGKMALKQAAKQTMSSVASKVTSAKDDLKKATSSVTDKVSSMKNLIPKSLPKFSVKNPFKSKSKQDRQDRQDIQQDLPPSYDNIPLSTGQALASDDSNRFNIFEGLNIIFSVTFPLAISISYILILAIVFLCIINVVLFIITGIYYLTKGSSDTILKDTIKYKLLNYVDYAIDGIVTKTLEEDKKSKAKEPIFFLFVINYFISIIFMIYIVLTIFYVGAFLMFLIVKIVLPFFSEIKSDNIDMEKDNLFIRYINFKTFIGLVIAVLFFVLYHVFFVKYMHPKLSTVRSAIHKIDVFIQQSISRYGKTISKDVLDVLKNKGKEDTMGAYSKMDNIIKKHFANNEYDKCKQAILLFTLYSHIYDKIPHSNQKALKLINYYFFNDPENQDDDINVKEDITSELSYISLMTEENGISPVQKVYDNLEIFSMESGEAKKIIDDVENVIDELNKKLQGFPEFKDMFFVFGSYMMVMMVLAICSIVVFNVDISKAGDKGEKKGMVFKMLAPLVKIVDAVLMRLFPGAVFLFMSLKYPKEDKICKANHADSDELYKKCMTESIARSDQMDNGRPEINNIMY